MTSAQQQRLQPDRLSGCVLATIRHPNEMIGTRNKTKQPVHLTGPLYAAHHADVRTVDLCNQVRNKELLKPEGVRKFHFQPESVRRFHPTVIACHSNSPQPPLRRIAPHDLAPSYSTLACKVGQVNSNGLTPVNLLADRLLRIKAGAA